MSRGMLGGNGITDAYPVMRHMMNIRVSTPTKVHAKFIPSQSVEHLRESALSAKFPMNMILLHGVLAASLATTPALPPNLRARASSLKLSSRPSTIPSFARTSRSDWIVSWGKLPLSDWQTALLAEDDEVRERLERTWRSRGSLGLCWTYCIGRRCRYFEFRMAALWTE